MESNRSRSEGSVSERLEAFCQAREQLRHRPLKGDQPGLNLSATTLWRMSQSEEDYPSSRFSSTMQDTLIQYFGMGRSDPMYRTIAARMGQTAADGKKCIDEFEGEYHLFSSPWEEAGLLPERRLRIAEIGGDPCFEQWPIGSPRTEAEHSGYVVHDDGKLYFQGLRNRAMSLMIVRAFDISRPMPGVMLSIFEADEYRKPFVTKAVLIQGVNFELVNKMQSAEGRILFQDFTKNTSAFI